MKIVNNYSKKSRDFEVNDGSSVTSTNQYITLSQMVQRVSRGESLPVHDYTLDNPFDCKDKFDVIDVFKKENEKFEASESDRIEKERKDAESAEKQKIIDEYLASKKESQVEKSE